MAYAPTPKFTQQQDQPIVIQNRMPKAGDAEFTGTMPGTGGGVNSTYRLIGGTQIGSTTPTSNTSRNPYPMGYTSGIPQGVDTISGPGAWYTPASSNTGKNNGDNKNGGGNNPGTPPKTTTGTTIGPRADWVNPNLGSTSPTRGTVNWKDIYTAPDNNPGPYDPNDIGRGIGWGQSGGKNPNVGNPSGMQTVRMTTGGVNAPQGGSEYLGPPEGTAGTSPWANFEAGTPRFGPEGVQPNRERFERWHLGPNKWYSAPNRGPAAPWWLGGTYNPWTGEHGDPKTPPPPPPPDKNNPDWPGLPDPRDIPGGGIPGAPPGWEPPGTNPAWTPPGTDSLRTGPGMGMQTNQAVPGSNDYYRKLPPYKDPRRRTAGEQGMGMTPGYTGNAPGIGPGYGGPPTTTGAGQGWRGGVPVSQLQLPSFDGSNPPSPQELLQMVRSWYEQFIAQNPRPQSPWGDATGVSTVYEPGAWERMQAIWPWWRRHDDNPDQPPPKGDDQLRSQRPGTGPGR